MDLTFKPVERTTVSEKIAKRIIALINTGKLKPGDKLPSERELMEQLHVSRSPIREALRSLSLIGLLETRPGDGTYISQHLTPALVNQIDWSMLIEKEDILEWLEVREPLEIQAAGLAAERATPEEIKHLEQMLSLYYNGIDDLERLVEREIRFHKAVVDMADNEILSELMEIFYGFYHRYVQQHRFYFTVKPREQGHQGIVQAIKAGDPDAAREAMRTHLSVSRQRALAEELDKRRRPQEAEG
ncbi:MAG: FadR/GntR family transcriptional regulator [Anaerolineae bacterium]